jgi:predicted N-formylglutamate amidohydrolase
MSAQARSDGAASGGAPGSTLQTFEAYELVKGDASAPVFLTCEHASQRIPEPWRWPEHDRRLVDTHWAYDLGAREVTLELADALGASAILSRFTRLLVDPNREENHDDLFRSLADGEPVLLNMGLEEPERERRIAGYHRPYHQAVDAALAATRAPVLLSIHSFTPVYQGEVRGVELGVLFNHEEQAALALGAALSAHFPNVAYNEPWSGRLGLIYAAERHAERYGRVALELEVRQDRALDRGYRRELVARLAEHFRSHAPSRD